MAADAAWRSDMRAGRGRKQMRNNHKQVHSLKIAPFQVLIPTRRECDGFPGPSCEWVPTFPSRSRTIGPAGLGPSKCPLRDVMQNLDGAAESRPWMAGFLASTKSDVLLLLLLLLLLSSRSCSK